MLERGAGEVEVLADRHRGGRCARQQQAGLAGDVARLESGDQVAFEVGRGRRAARVEDQGRVADPPRFAAVLHAHQDACVVAVCRGLQRVHGVRMDQQRGFRPHDDVDGPAGGKPVDGGEVALQQGRALRGVDIGTAAARAAGCQQRDAQRGRAGVLLQAPEAEPQRQADEQHRGGQCARPGRHGRPCRNCRGERAAAPPDQEAHQPKPAHGGKLHHGQGVHLAVGHMPERAVRRGACRHPRQTGRHRRKRESRGEGTSLARQRPEQQHRRNQGQRRQNDCGQHHRQRQADRAVQVGPLAGSA